MSSGGHHLEQERFRQVTYILLVWQKFCPMSGTGAQKGCAASDLGGFYGLCGQSPERPGLTSELILLWAGGWTSRPPELRSNLSYPLTLGTSFSVPEGKKEGVGRETEAVHQRKPSQKWEEVSTGVPWHEKGSLSIMGGF